MASLGCFCFDTADRKRREQHEKTRFLSLILALGLTLGLTACGQAQTAGTAGTPEPEPSAASEPVQTPAPAPSEAPEEPAAPVEVPTLSVTSTIFGSGDTGGKSTLKNTLLTAEGPGDQTIRYSDPETGERLDYPVDAVIDQPPVTYTGSAILTLEGEGLDDSLIDSSGAVVKLVPGDGYYDDELILAADTLEGTWENGTLEYTLSQGDLEWNIGDYQYLDDNSGREWSVFGGDGNGCYTFTLEVSGITYGGAPVEAATFPVQVYIWGRSGTDLCPEYADLEAVPGASGQAQTDAVQWTWIGDGDQPILCDSLTDDFYITWPAGSDASGLTAENVTVTLRNQYGVSYELKPEEQFRVFSGAGETQVAVTFQHAAFTPVFTTMEIAVSGGELEASETFDVGSVYTYMVQQGGGGLTVDGVTTAYSYYGYEGLSIDNAVQATYTLATQVDGKTMYYAEDESGKGYLSEAVEQETVGFFGETRTVLAAPEDAVVYDAMGPEDCDVQFIVNTLLVKSRLDKTEVKVIDGTEVELNKSYTSGTIASWEGVTAAPGYVMKTDAICPNQMWAWSDRYAAGWAPELNVLPTAFPYTEFPYGSYEYTSKS